MTRLNKIKIYFRILAAVLIITLTAAPGIALAAGLADSGQRVFDYAGLFDSVEEERMQKELEAIISHTEADVVILTIDDAGGKEAVAYADDFFDEEGFGIGDNYDGVLFLIDMDNRELTVSTSGSMIEVLPDYRLELMLDHIYEAAGEDNFKESAWRFITDLKVYYDQYLKDEARTAYNIAERSEREKESAAAAASDIKNKKYEQGYKAQRRDFSLEWYEVLLSLGVAAFVAVCVCKSVVNSYRMKGAGKGDAQLNLSYRSGCHMNNVERRDTLIDRSVTTQVISQPSAPRADFSSSYDDDSSSYSSGLRSSSNSSSRASGYSTTHTSSSGRTHGGSSRSFSGGSSGGGGRNSSGGSRSFSSGSSSRSSGSSSTHSSGSSSSSSSGPSSSRSSGPSSGRSSGGGRSHGGGSRKF